LGLLPYIAAYLIITHLFEFGLTNADLIYVIWIAVISLIGTILKSITFTMAYHISHIAANDTLYYENDINFHVIKKCYEALNPKGVVVSIHGVIEQDHTKPKDMVIAMLPDALADRGEIPSPDFLSKAFLKAGFKSIKIFDVMSIANSMEVNIARKG
jgi:hypothetical protein